MKPYLICHMIASVDGRTSLRRWRPLDESRGALFERLHERLGSDAWLVGRVTGEEYGKLDAYPRHIEEIYPREPWFVRRDAAAYGHLACFRCEPAGDAILPSEPQGTLAIKGRAVELALRRSFGSGKV